MAGRNGKGERSLYNFLAEISKELNEAIDDKGMHSAHSREALADLCGNLKKSISVLLEVIDKPAGSWQEEVVKIAAFSDLDKANTLNYCIEELGKFLEEHPDLDTDFADRIKNKLQEIKSPEAI